VEPVQAESGITPASKDWLAAIAQKCKEHCVLFIFDEIQSGFGRTGSMFAFEQLGVVPDILLVGKALGGGLPLGAFISHPRMMGLLTESPVLGHITTFGGNPVCCAAGNAALQVLQNSGWIKEVAEKENILVKQMIHPAIINRTHKGLWMSLQFESDRLAKKIAATCVTNGIITDWFLFAEDRIRIAPPLCITNEELSSAIEKIKLSIDQALQ
jgi:acetylornithine/succinyldiaminopimelate/putrescine aminotransferase